MVSRILAIASTAALVCSCGGNEDGLGPAECRKNSVTVSGKAESPVLFVDRTYLRILVKPFAETYYLRDIVDYMLANGFSALETTTTGPGDLLPWGGPPGPALVRISVKPLGDPACEAYDYVKQYPAQALPWLRGLGLQVNECVGVERISAAERSNLRILVDEHVLKTAQQGQLGPWTHLRLEVRVVDASSKPERVVARMTDHYEKRGGGKAGIFHLFPCKEGDQQTKVLAQAFASSGSRPKRPEVQEVDTAIQLADSEPVRDEDLKSFTWLSQPDKFWSTNVIDPQGVAWISWAPKAGDPVHRFNLFLENRIVSTRIPLPPERGVQDATGLARTEAGWAVVTGVNVRKPGSNRYLVQFDTTGVLVKAAALSDSQYAMLSGSK